MSVKDDVNQLPDDTNVAWKADQGGAWIEADGKGGYTLHPGDGEPLTDEDSVTLARFMEGHLAANHKTVRNATALDYVKGVQNAAKLDKSSQVRPAGKAKSKSKSKAKAKPAQAVQSSALSSPQHQSGEAGRQARAVKSSSSSSPAHRSSPSAPGTTPASSVQSSASSSPQNKPK